MPFTTTELNNRRSTTARRRHSRFSTTYQRLLVHCRTLLSPVLLKDPLQKNRNDFLIPYNSNNRRSRSNTGSSTVMGRPTPMVVTVAAPAQ
ncbi:hypothetical protein J6590_055154 [Homalodisca vitripennis]|nr:hypothetical protein J6590_055154 [Homalodisca vitripennis]